MPIYPNNVIQQIQYVMRLKCVTTKSVCHDAKCLSIRIELCHNKRIPVTVSIRTYTDGVFGNGAAHFCREFWAKQHNCYFPDEAGREEVFIFYSSSSFCQTFQLSAATCSWRLGLFFTHLSIDVNFY
jgi:hypothetical protein